MGIKQAKGFLGKGLGSRMLTGVQQVPGILGKAKDKAVDTSNTIKDTFVVGGQKVAAGVKNTQEAFNAIVTQVKRSYGKFRNIGELVQELKSVNLRKIEEVDKDVVSALEYLLVSVDLASIPLIGQIIGPIVLALSSAGLLFTGAKAVYIRAKLSVLLPAEILKEIFSQPSYQEGVSDMKKLLELTDSLEEEVSREELQRIQGLVENITTKLQYALDDETMDLSGEDTGVLRTRYNVFYLNMMKEINAKSPNRQNLHGSVNFLQEFLEE